MISTAAAVAALPRLRWAAPPAAAKPWRSLPSRSRSSAVAAATLEPPDLPRLADAARISLSPEVAKEFAPKIRLVVDWFGELQAVDLESIEPSLRANTEAGAHSRDDVPETFKNREAIIEAVPRFDYPYIKVPKVLNKE